MCRARKLALVTGASSGLGIAFARELARRGYDLVLTARSETAMKALAEELALEGAAVHIEAIDLGESGGAMKLAERLDRRGLEPDVLINNAGVGIKQPFSAHHLDALRSMLQLNVVSSAELTRIFGARMKLRKDGHMLLVASLAAYSPSATMAAYAASKSFILSLGEALNAEMAPDVKVTVVSPGLMDTGFNAVAGFETKGLLKLLVRPTSMVAKVGLDALFAGRASVVAGRLNQLLVLVGKMLPRGVVRRRTETPN